LWLAAIGHVFDLIQLGDTSLARALHASTSSRTGFVVAGRARSLSLGDLRPYVCLMARTQTDIVIAGGGVAGLTAAVAFGQAGFGVTIIDPTPPVINQSDAGADLRTTAFLQPARAFLERAGTWERYAPFATPLKTMRIVDAAQDPVVEREFHSADISDAPFGWNLPNWLLRRELVDALKALPNVDFRAGVGFRAMLPRLRENIVTLDDGKQLSAKLVIGADVAEAAHVMPPIGAQGLNMSLTDLDCLLNLAQTHSADLGSEAMLDAYQKARHGDIKLRVRGIDALNRASIAGGPLTHGLRGLGLKALHDVAPVRKGLMSLGLGARS